MSISPLSFSSLTQVGHELGSSNFLSSLFIFKRGRRSDDALLELLRAVFKGAGEHVRVVHQYGNDQKRIEWILRFLNKVSGMLLG
jgi:hypothetical protein